MSKGFANFVCAVAPLGAVATLAMAGRLSVADAERAGFDSYYQAAATRTAPNSTLFVAFGRDCTVPRESRAAHAEAVFGLLPGYIGVRAVRNLSFVDFESVKAATAAMMRLQGKDGMTIDYDKDDGKASKRKREADDQLARRQHAAQSGDYFCCRCGTKALRTSGRLLSELPSRGTDGATVVDESTQLERLSLEPITGSQPLLVKRAKGTEKQFRLGCRSCATPIAYRSTAAAAPGKYLYVERGTVQERPPDAEQVQRRRADEQAQQKAREDFETGDDRRLPSASQCCG